MKNWQASALGVGIGLVIISCAGAYVGGLTASIPWGYEGMQRAKEWVSPDGRMSLQSHIPGMSTAWDCWPTTGSRPTEHSLCELTLNRYQWDHERLERISLSAMADQTDEGAYRVSIEKGRKGIHRPLLLCFDNAVAGGEASCPLKVAPDGVYVQTEEGYKKL